MTSSLICEQMTNWMSAKLARTRKLTFMLPLLLIFFAGWLVGCSQSEEEMQAIHKQTLIENYTINKIITLGVVWDNREGEFLSGAILAAEEINAAGGINGRALRLKYVDEMPYVDHIRVQRATAEGRYRNGLQLTGMFIAKNILSNPEIAAVIGHSNPDSMLSSVIIYQRNNILLLSAKNDSLSMWTSENNYFQLLLPDELVAKIMTKKFKDQNWDNVYFFYENNHSYERLAELINTEFATQNLSVTGQIAVAPYMFNDSSVANASKRILDIFTQLRDGKTNAIALITGPNLAAKIIRGSRTFGLLLPFFGTSALDNPDFINMVGEDGINTIIVSPRNSGYQYNFFEQKFQKRFPDKKADVAAALGYDSVALYADAVAMVDTVNPFRVSHVLSFKLPVWYGVLGNYIFKDRVNIGLDYPVRRLTREKDGIMRFVPDEEEN